jgi:hypothetical protein
LFIFRNSTQQRYAQAWALKTHIAVKIQNAISIECTFRFVGLTGTPPNSQFERTFGVASKW